MYEKIFENGWFPSLRDKMKMATNPIKTPGR